MGQKIHPGGFRVGYIQDWKSNWFDEKGFADVLYEDLKIRDHIVGKLAHAGLSDITIERRGEVTVDIHTARPGIVIKIGERSGRPAQDLQPPANRSSEHPRGQAGRARRELVAQSIAEQLQNRVAFRRAMKRALTSAIAPGQGREDPGLRPARRLGDGAHRTYSDGRVPLHTLRANIDYGFYEARTTAGRIGVKCWINKGEVMPEGFRSDQSPADGEPQGAPAARGGNRRGSARGGGWSLMLMPKRVKHRKQMRGRMRGNTKGGSTVAFGEYGLKSLDRGWITNRQIEAAASR